MFEYLMGGCCGVIGILGFFIGWWLRGVEKKDPEGEWEDAQWDRAKGEEADVPYQSFRSGDLPRASTPKPVPPRPEADETHFGLLPRGWLRKN